MEPWLIVFCLFRGATGKGRETRALPAPEPTQRITSHPFATPLHRIRTENMLPSKLLTPFQASLLRAVIDSASYDCR